MKDINLNTKLMGKIGRNLYGKGIKREESRVWDYINLEI